MLEKNYPEEKQTGEMQMLGAGALMLSESLTELKFVFQPWTFNVCVCRAFAVQVRRGEDGARWSCVSITLFRAILD